MLSASSVLMNVLENQSTPSIREEQLSLNNAEVLSLGDSSPRSTISSSLIEIEENSEYQNSRIQTNTSFHFQNHQDSDQEEESDDEFNQLVLIEHSYNDEESKDENEELNFNQQHELTKLSPPKSKPLKTNAEFRTSTTVQHQPKENSSFRSSFSSSRSNLLKGNTTTTLVRNSTSSSLNGSFGFGSSASRFSLDHTSSSSKSKAKSSPSFKRDLELENELLGQHNRPTTPTNSKSVRSASPISKTISEEAIYTPPSDLSSITLKDKKEIEKTVERLKVRQRYLEDRVKRESTPPKRIVPPKPRVYTSSERVVTKPLYESNPILTLTQLQNSLEVEKRKKRIEDKRRELQESKNMRAKAIRDEKQRRETFLKEDSILSRPIPEIKRPSTPSLTRRSTTPTNSSKRPSSSFAERPKSSISIETVKPQQKTISSTSQTMKSSSRIVPKDTFSKQNSFLSDSSYRSQKDVKDFNALLKEQEKLLNNIRELKNKIQPTSKK
ncbi:predicted protein [Naegleria gruberi]|uniref:Predicted protein n=1 Tax=Naegleria gruberi TaxID=5762 RepID=D2VUP9_NAEGR|nr:uncharacterized protein NAEGRDRAFT_52405 [Naegleria gruberi]EFC39544.1 predicted protein [Naegleria gruberi]|eukprot:XP_002672288.1 predicted protein [Naegleria gruberi strain NEG-M]